MKPTGVSSRHCAEPWQSIPHLSVLAHEARAVFERYYAIFFNVLVVFACEARCKDAIFVASQRAGATHVRAYLCKYAASRLRRAAARSSIFERLAAYDA